MSEIIPLPEHAPQEGEIYRHYKGDLYKVISLPLHSDDDEWMIVYAPMYENPAASLFVKPLREWSKEVEWSGKRVSRFTKVS